MTFFVNYIYIFFAAAIAAITGSFHLDFAFSDTFDQDCFSNDDNCLYWYSVFIRVRRISYVHSLATLKPSTFSEETAFCKRRPLVLFIPRTRTSFPVLLYWKKFEMRLREKNMDVFPLVKFDRKTKQMSVEITL